MNVLVEAAASIGKFILLLTALPPLFIMGLVGLLFEMAIILIEKIVYTRR